MENCRLEYDFLSSGYEIWWFPAIGIAVAALLAAAYGMQYLILGTRLSRMKKILAVTSILGALVWALAVLFSTYFQHRVISANYQNGKFSEVAGVIEGFISAIPGRAAKESFSVGKVHFSYSKYIVKPGYRRVQSDGGALRNGVKVKIRYMGRIILRVEICE